MSGTPGPKAPYTAVSLEPPVVVVVESRAGFLGDPLELEVVIRTPRGDYRGVVRR